MIEWTDIMAITGFLAKIVIIVVGLYIIFVWKKPQENKP